MKKSNYLLAIALGASTITFAQVGIGTSSPSNALDIETTGPAVDINDTGGGDPEINFQISGTTTFSIGIDNSDSDKLKIGTTAPDASTSVTIDASQNVGIGTSSPDTKLEVNGGDLKVTDDAGEVYIYDAGAIEIARAYSGSAASYIDFKNLIADDYDCRIQQDNSNGLQFETGGNGATAIAVTIDASQNVGIGNTSPTAKLDVDGSAIFNESGAAVDFRVEGDTEANLLFVDASADKVGIGTSSPGAGLDVRIASGSAAAAINLNTKAASSVGDGPAITFGHSASETAARISTYAVSSNSGHFLIETNSGSGLTERIRVQNDGYVGIGTSSPGYILTVNGQPGANGYTAFTNYSDRRLKTNIDSLENGALDKILQLNPVSFQYNDKYLQLYPESDLKRVHKGFIAQEIQKVFPEMVSEMKESPDSVQYLDLDISHLQVYLVKALQEQQAIIEAQKKEIETQKAELDTQKAENAAQEKEVEEVKADASTNAEEIEALKAQVQQLLQLIQQQESASVGK